MRRIPELDAIRGLAAVAVLLHHFYGRLMPFGWASVDLFFVLSGYLITRIIIAERDSDRFLFVFFVRRSLRIWPIYYASLLLIVVANPFLLKPYPLDGLGWYLAYLQNLPVYWSGRVPAFNRYFGHTATLAIEEQFYLIWPVLIGVMGRRRIIPSTLVFIGIAVGSRALGYPEIILMARCDGLALGALLGALHSDADWMKRHGSRLLKTSVVLLVGLGMALAWVRFRFGGTAGLAAWPWVRSLAILAINLFFTALIAVLADRSGRPSLALLRDPRLCYLGTISYGLYLYHLVIWIFIDDAASRLGLSNAAWLGLLTMGLTLIVSIASWEFFERPILRLKDRFPYDKSKASAPSPLGSAVPPDLVIVN